MNLIFAVRLMKHEITWDEVPEEKKKGVRGVLRRLKEVGKLGEEDYAALTGEAK